MKPIQEKNDHPPMTIGMPKVVGNVQRTTLSYEVDGQTLEHNIDVELEDNEEKPSYETYARALNRGIDKFHRKIRKFIGVESKQPIRTVR